MTNIEKIYTTSHNFVKDSHCEILGENNCCDALIYNRKGSPIILLYENDRKKTQSENLFEESLWCTVYIAICLQDHKV